MAQVLSGQVKLVDPLQSRPGPPGAGRPVTAVRLYSNRYSATSENLRLSVHSNLTPTLSRLPGSTLPGIIYSTPRIEVQAFMPYSRHAPDLCASRGLSCQRRKHLGTQSPRHATKVILSR